MDEMFDELDFIGLNLLQELRDDNMELKNKVEEHEVTIDRLQTGYDLMALELRSLQSKYNSLLSGVKLVTNQKSPMVAQLNKEKEANKTNEGSNYDRPSGSGGKDDPKMDKDITRKVK